MQTNLTHIPRNAASDFWREMYRNARKLGYRERFASTYDPLEERAALAKRVAECRGATALFIRLHGHDCDHCTYDYIRTCPPNVVALNRFLDDQYQYADGPMGWQLLTPAQAQEHSPAPSRDLVLEAFENGHPHVVRY